MPAKNTKVGDRIAQPQPFSVFHAKNRRFVGVRIGTKRAYSSCAEVFITAGAVLVRPTAEGIVITGEGVVRQEGDVVRITG